ncbi:MAG: RagB/SusD family nutrient uptake outer membrane protein [Marinoscillum sp.]
MKNLLKYAYLSLFLVLLGSCDQDILDKVPKDSLTEEIIWSDPNAATQFVFGIYGAIPSGFDRNYQGWAKALYILDAGSDDAENAIDWTSADLLNTGDFQASNVPYGEIWADCYRLVRAANQALENLDKLEDQELATQLKAETRFLRAYLYHDLLRYYGLNSSGGEPTGVPIVDRTLTPDDDPEEFTQRDTYDDVVDFIVDDLDSAILDLPTLTETEFGRATVGAAYALKGRVLLYAERYEESASASLEVINGGGYSLYPDYQNIFLDENNEEVVWVKKFELPDKTHQSNAGGTAGAGWDVYNAPRTFAGPNDAGWVGNCPTQNFVDAYEMIDGQDQGASPLYDPASPFDNLDPRFDATVVHDGSEFRGEVMQMYPGGNHDLPGANTPTGYYTRKFHREDVPVYTLAGDQDWLFIRYAEVLLNYAEAQNENIGPDGSVYNAINEIRARPSVSMPALPLGLNQDEMRTRIRNERRIELVYEEHRFYDIRRWRIAENVVNGPMEGIEMTSFDFDEDGVVDSVGYTRFEFETRTFPAKLYVMPVPQNEMDKSPGLEQIGGW